MKKPMIKKEKIVKIEKVEKKDKKSKMPMKKHSDCGCK
jgi:hypothetical protein